MKKNHYLPAFLGIIFLLILIGIVAFYIIVLRDPSLPEFYEPTGTFTQGPTVERFNSNVIKFSWALPQRYEKNEILFQGKKQMSVMRAATKKTVTSGVGVNVRFDEETNLYVYEGLLGVGDCEKQQEIIDRPIICNSEKDQYIFQAISFTNDLKTGVASTLQTLDATE